MEILAILLKAPTKEIIVVSTDSKLMNAINELIRNVENDSQLKIDVYKPSDVLHVLYMGLDDNATIG